ncbi:MAG: prolyl-tRNA synthetase [Candidatus Yanofskybacteria bacterium]|nr:prolyl-tRNA synthetase [Candidatus Yanofskybacteria bacterium]
MRFTHLFTKTRKEVPADEAARNAELLIRAGFVFKEMAGVYTFLPLGLRVLNKVEAIIRDEMNKAGGIEMRTSVLQSKDVWERTDRWSDDVVDNWFKTKLKTGGEVGLSFTNEEAYSNILTQYVSSYKDLPIYPYDFKSIFRNEARSKSGMLRGREFYWKALYSFSKTDAEHTEFYEKMKAAYRSVFDRVGIGHRTYLTFASGGSFSKFSHEFQAVTPAGEDTIYLDEQSGIAVNKEVHADEVLAELGLQRDALVERTAIEVGNIFSLGTRFSVPFGLEYQDEHGSAQPVIMGSYGIGLSRLIGAVVEILSDEKGIVWPQAIAPFTYHLVVLGEKREEGDKLYTDLVAAGAEVLYDDRPDKSAGEKFADADLIGCPVRLTLGGKTEAGKVEYKLRTERESRLIAVSELR